VPVQTSRGCKHVCSFCSWISLFGKPGYRVRPPEDVVHDIAHAMEYVGTKDFIVCDNLFAGDRSHAEELMGRLARAFENRPVKPSLTVCMRADQFVEGSQGALSEKEIALLVRGGVSVVSFGLESVEEQSLSQMRKGVDTDKYLSASRTLRRHGISFLGTFVAGFDSDTPESIARIAEFAERMGLFTVQIYARSVTPETTDMAFFWHRMLPGRLNRYANGHSVWFLPSMMLPSRMQEQIFRTTLKFHEGSRSRKPAYWVFSGIWDRLQNHQRALKRIESEVLLPMGVYRPLGREFRLSEDRLRTLCENEGSHAWYLAACSRIFREEEAAAPFGSPVVRAGSPQVFVGTGPVA